MVDIQTVVPPVPAQRKYQMKDVVPNGIPNGTDCDVEVDRSTTTLSTIVSAGYVEMRINEMRPGLLAIGGTCEEAAALLNIHEDLMARLRDKEDQVTALLIRADNLSSEKQANEAIVYEDMAKCLNEAWRGLKKQLMLRGYLLREVLNFYQLAQHHEELVNTTTEALKTVKHAKHETDIATSLKTLEHNINEIIDMTAHAVDVGSSVIAQIRTLGQISDNTEQAQEILSSCVLIEKVMLGIASEWERIEAEWKCVSEKIIVSESSEELLQIEQWLKHAERRIKAVNETGLRRLLEEGDAHQVRLAQLGADSHADNSKIAHLSGMIEEFLYYVKTRLNRSQRIQAFFQSAQTMLSQITMMAEDMKNANAAMAGELYPLAEQKVSAVISEGKDILEKEVLSYEEKALAKQRLDELETKLRLLEELALQRQKGIQEISEQIAKLQSWNTMEVVPFLATHSDLGGTLNEAVDFLDAHKKFIEEVANNEAVVVSLVSRQSDMTSVEENAIKELKKICDELKEVVEHRSHIGNNFVQVYKFAKDLESSFDALTSLLDGNRDFANERLVGQVDGVFHMIDETIEKEKHDVERFVMAAEAVTNIDKKLNVERAVQAARNFIVDHDHRLTYAKHMWAEWRRKKAEMKKIETIIEEIQMWQEDAWEIIRLLENTKTTSLQDSEGLYRRVKEFQQTVGQQTVKLDETKKYEMSENILKKVDNLMRKQQEIKERVTELEKKVETIYETFMEQEVTKHIRAPQILTSLKDSQIDEGNRFEFVARIEGEPEPKIS
ncbi:hypothetical protein DICVIV_10998 [Dictyocaulus viviparus]|uniref:Spectrin repeat-containing domain protein n=1 Tax=Dictyocaulus viviparus TaxID=29172 RepID=A0A0D8XGY3_DICVI|nr:hypothetical protein DICVIV_10998 [Dictyocaulus viviparus]